MMQFNTFNMRDDIDELWNPDNSFFDVCASFGSMGKDMECGMSMNRLFWNPKKNSVHAPVVFLRQFVGQEFAEPAMLGSCIDKLMASSLVESICAFTAWLTVTPIAPTPVNTTLLAEIRLHEVPEEPGKKPSKVKKMMATLELTDGAKRVYATAEGLFVRPAAGGMDLRFFQATGLPNAQGDRPAWTREEMQASFDALLEARAEEIGAPKIEEAKAERASCLSLLKNEASGESVLVRVPNAELVEQQWLEAHPIFKQMPTLLSAPADPVSGAEYLKGGVLMRFSHEVPKSEPGSSGLGETDEGEGTVCVVGAAHFLPSVEGPPGCAHGGSAYGTFEQLFRQARKAARRAVDSAEHQQPTPKLQYKAPLPVNGTYRLECRVCEVDENQRAFRGSLKSLDGNTVYILAEEVLPAGLFGLDEDYEDAIVQALRAGVPEAAAVANRSRL
jgi:hypothetical protein